MSALKIMSLRLRKNSMKEKSGSLPVLEGSELRAALEILSKIKTLTIKDDMIKILIKVKT